jgi:hypothetical protein
MELLTLFSAQELISGFYVIHDEMNKTPQNIRLVDEPILLTKQQNTIHLLGGMKYSSSKYLKSYVICCPSQLYRQSKTIC